ncbi:putative MFS family arabinose efflux permease [Glaciihabitans tibetensis]|uniref:Putative MFS family arabinose efflux permease n=1 Tax=Glaciihabitans tibetensis TaxID=1266600 RepID=A0A2T0V9V4_9MICO|nr:MFS transporter [Glaciihabitans tibetensis]PRY66933.1 putative MFS family arabinose efflux permease [Glaciihabitans tibetensis]
MFRSLGVVNYRLWFAGALVSNVGTWMQRTAQDWVVLTELTDHDAVAVGITMALQFGPQLLLLPISGLIADRVDRRRLLMITQSAMGLLALGLGLIMVLGVAELWQVYAFALGLGVVSAIDAPARQAFVSELVTERSIPNAVALNSASFNGARLIGPALAGVLIAAIGSGWVFLLNVATFVAMLVALKAMHIKNLQPSQRAPRERGQIRAGFRYVGSRPDIVVILVIVFIIGTFGLNFTIFTATMATVEFGQGSSTYGALSSILAVGSVTGALLAARRDRPRMAVVIFSSLAFGLACLTAAVMPTLWSFAFSLVVVGLCSMTLLTSANAYVQTTSTPALRGRVMAVYMAILAGGTPVGAPLVGWVSNTFGPRWALGVAAAAGIIAGAIALTWMYVSRHLRLRFDRDATAHFSLRYDGDRRDDDQRGNPRAEVSPAAAAAEVSAATVARG